MPQGILQSVVISKEIAKTAEEAKKIARDFGAEIKKTEETSTSWRFRQVEPNPSATYKTFNPPGKPGVALIYENEKMSEPLHYRSAPRLFKFDELETSQDEIGQEVELLRVGTFYDPRYGKVDITGEHLDAFVKNFNEKSRKVDLAIDYAHKSDEEAAGWITELYRGGNDNNTLLGRVKWTGDGKKVLADRKFRYLSADFSLSYKDNETLKEYGPTLFGAGLTNRPVIKGMKPAIQLSEGDGMPTLEELASENLDLKKQLADYKKKLAELSPPEDEEKKDMPTEVEIELQKKLSEEIKKREAAEKKVADNEAETKKLAEEKAKKAKGDEFEKLLSEGKAVEAQREAFLSGDLAKFTELAQNPKTHRMSEGNDRDGNGAGEKSAADQVIELAQKRVTDKLSNDMGSAISYVLSEPANKALIEKYYGEGK